MDKLQAIVFDMDGTLADTEEIHRQAFNQAFKEFGFPWQWSRQAYITLLNISGGRERLRSFLEVELGTTRKGSATQLALELHKRKSEIYRDMLAGHIRLRPGVERLIDEARRKKITLAVATSSSGKNLETLLHHTLGDDALSWFRTVVTCDVVVEKKPSPAVYEFVLSRIGVKRGHCIAIEDTHNGNTAALSAGIKTVITTHYFTRDDDFEGASLVVDQLGEPGQPFKISAGNAYGADYVDVELLRRIMNSGPVAEQEHAWDRIAAVE